MQTWAWLIAYLLGFALLQLYLYRYFVGGESASNSSAEGATPRGASPVEAGNAESRSGPDGEYITCAECGVHNEGSAVFTYCKHCGTRL